MNLKARIPTARTCLLLGSSLLAGVAVALFAGCKGNTTSAALLEHHAGKPPVVVARRVATDLKSADPLTLPAWQNAMLPFTAPENTPRTTAPTRGAVLFDAKTLYAAFICEKPPTLSAQSRDVVSLYIDTHAEGKELLQLTIDSTGATRCAWLRSSEPAQPLDDGSPNLGHPVIATPDLVLKGLWSEVHEGIERGNGVWIAQVAIPLSSLPGPLQAKAAAGEHWRFNLARTFTTLNGGRVVDQTQSNLSPFYINAQAVSPYRMAELDFAGE